MTNSPAIVTMVAPVGSCQNHDAQVPASSRDDPDDGRYQESGPEVTHEQ